MKTRLGEGKVDDMVHINNIINNNTNFMVHFNKIRSMEHFNVLSEQ